MTGSPRGRHELCFRQQDVQIGFGSQQESDRLFSKNKNADEVDFVFRIPLNPADSKAQTAPWPAQLCLLKPNMPRPSWGQGAKNNTDPLPPEALP